MKKIVSLIVAFGILSFVSVPSLAHTDVYFESKIIWPKHTATFNIPQIRQLSPWMIACAASDASSGNIINKYSKGINPIQIEGSYKNGSSLEPTYKLQTIKDGTKEFILEQGGGLTNLLAHEVKITNVAGKESDWYPILVTCVKK